MTRANTQSNVDLKLPRELPYRSRKLQTIEPSAIDWKGLLFMLPILLFFSMVVKFR